MRINLIIPVAISFLTAGAGANPARLAPDFSQLSGLEVGCKAGDPQVDSPFSDTTDKRNPPSSAPLLLPHFGGYVQLRYQLSDGDTSRISSADIRRMRFSLAGRVTEPWSYFFQADFAASPRLLDAYIDYSPFRFLRVKAGQFKIPFSRENLMSSARLDFIDRSQVVESLVARSGDVAGNQSGRDVGVQVGGRLAGCDSTSSLEYAAGVFNGSGINVPDRNDAKDFCGRIVIQPVREIHVGVSYYDGFDVWGSPPVSGRRTRFGLEFDYADSPLEISGEYIGGNDGAISRRGGYLQAAYYVAGRDLQIAARFDTYNPDVSMRDMISTDYVFGATYLIASNVRVQGNYLIWRGRDNRAGDILEVQLQCEVP